MANKVYPKYKKAAMSGGANTNLMTGNVKVVLVDTDPAAYVYSDAHEFLSNVPAGARIAATGNLTGKSVSDLAAFDSDNPRLESVVGPSSEALIGYIDTGIAATSRLVWYQDVGVTGLPVTPEGGSYNIVVDAAGWFTL